MLIQRFEPRDRRLTNFHYYYYHHQSPCVTVVDITVGLTLLQLTYHRQRYYTYDFNLRNVILGDINAEHTLS